MGEDDDAFWDFWGFPPPDNSGPLPVYENMQVVSTTNSNPMNEETDFTVDESGAAPLNATDKTSGGGFWESLGNALGGAFGGVANNAIQNATASANQYIKKNLAPPATNSTQTQQATAAASQRNLWLTAGLLVAVGAFFYSRKK